MTSKQIPVACNLELAEFGERNNQWVALTKTALVRKEPTATGLRMTFVGSAAEKLERLAAAEAECCGFATWTVTRGEADELVLEVAAEGFGVDAVRAMFD